MKRKIIIGITIFVGFAIFMCILFTFTKKSNNIQLENLVNTDNVEKSSSNEEIIETVNVIENEIVDTENIENKSEEKVSSEEIFKKVEAKEQKKETVTNNATTYSQEIAKTETQGISNNEQKNNQEQKSIANNENKEEVIISKEETPKQEIQTVEERFEINNDMINKMKNIINSNVSDSMNTYGYEIQIDNSIINLTSQFTYTDIRVKNKIANKFGTIRIYARDYYKNGTLVWTECYIL